MNEIQEFQKALYSDYLIDLKEILPENYKYFTGISVNPVVPLDIGRNGVMIIGAYPSAHFVTINGITDVPFSDNFYPFPNYKYFDRSRTRIIKSGVELETEYLSPLKLTREKCWITNLVRVFLFKKGHIKKYRDIDCAWPERETRSLFYDLSKAGSHWLDKELELVSPKLIITLGREVAGYFHDIKNPEKQNGLLTGEITEVEIEAKTYPAIHFAHPGIIMRAESERNKWPKCHRECHIPKARKIIKNLGL